MLHDHLNIESIVHQLLQEAQEAISDEGERRVKRAEAAQEQDNSPETKGEGAQGDQ